MNLEHDYTIYFNQYKNLSESKLRSLYPDIHYIFNQSNVYIFFSLICFLFVFLVNILFIIGSLIFLIFALYYYAKYHDAFFDYYKKQFKIKSGKQKFIYYYLFNKLKNDNKFYNRDFLLQLIRYSDLKIQINTNGFLYNPIIILLISIIISFSVNRITELDIDTLTFDQKTLIVLLIYLIVFICIFIVNYYLYNKTHNKNIRFKAFLLEVLYDLENNYDTRLLNNRPK